jgi:hypothetical protein
MEKFNISVIQAGEVFYFQVVNQGTDKCEYEYIHICRNAGGLDEEVIVRIAGRIGAHYL